MNVREWSNQHPRVMAIAASVCAIIGVSAIATQVLGNRHKISMHGPDHYFSVDDGKSFFRAESTNVAPFDYEGGVAVRAHVFECDGHQFVAYLERYTPEARQVELSGKPIPIDVELYGRELKKPGDSKWVSTHSSGMLKDIVVVKCPGGSNSQPTPIEP